MRGPGFRAMAVALIGGAMILFGPDSASATALPGFAVAVPSATGLVDEIASHERARPTLEYDQRQHGARYPSRRPGFTFHYDGYYYANPWWLDPEIGIEVTEPTQLPPAHVQWCRDRYSSYEPATDTYVPRIGVRARCDSPYVTR